MLASTIHVGKHSLRNGKSRRRLLRGLVGRALHWNRNDVGLIPIRGPNNLGLTIVYTLPQARCWACKAWPGI